MKKRTKRNLKMALKVWGRMVISGIMCAVISVSFSVLANGLLSQEVGYRIAQLDENGQGTILEEVYYKDGQQPIENDDIKLEKDQYLERINEMSPGVSAAVNAVVLVCSLFLLGVFPYNLLWEMGSKDENRVRYGRSRLDKLRGLKIGALANIPSLLLYVFLLVARFGSLSNGILSVYRVLNMPFLSYINWIIGTDLSAIVVWQLLALLVPMLFVPAVCYIAYLLGFRQFSLKEHLTYEKTEQADEEI